MAQIIRAAGPDGSRIPVHLDLCIAYPLVFDGQRLWTLYRKPAEKRPVDAGPDGDVWICLEQITLDRWTHRELRTRSCRVVTPEQAHELFRWAEKAIPAELADDAARASADLTAAVAAPAESPQGSGQAVSADPARPAQAPPAGPPVDSPPSGTASDRVPSVDRLIEVYAALRWFAFGNDRPGGHYVFEQEDEWLARFGRLADALRPIRPRFGGFKVWPGRIERAVRAICEAFDKTAQTWGWEELDVPEPERSAHVAARRLWRKENRDRPMYEAAISGEDHPAFDRTERGLDVRRIAAEGRCLGYGRTMSEEEGEARFSDAKTAWCCAPFLGDVRPAIGPGEYEEFSWASSMLRPELRRLAPSRIAEIEVPASPVEPPADPAPPVGSDRPSDRTEAAAEQSARRPEGEPAADPPALTPVEPHNLVTLDQAAAIVNKSKRALEYYKTKGTLPAPAVEGGGGKASLYDWTILGPWLTAQFGIPLPVRFPGR